MIVIKNPELKESVYNNIRNAVIGEREGIHLSDLIYCPRKAYYRKMGLSPAPTDELCVLWLTGYSFQAYLFPLDKEIPLLVDRIGCTPDVPTGIEVKSTRQSSKNFAFDTMAHWKRQILGYCKALNVLEYDLVVLFLMNNYAPPFPAIDCWHITTTQEEVDENWKEMVMRRDILEEALLEGEPPPPDCADWEYKWCENIDLCQDTVCWRKRQLGGKK